MGGKHRRREVNGNSNGDTHVQGEWEGEWGHPPFS